MKLVLIKTARELKLPGVHVEFVTEGDVLKELILRPEGEPESYCVRSGETYSSSIKVFIRREFEMKERFRLSGTMHGIKFQQDYDSQGEAESAKRQLPASGEYEINPVKVRVDEAGEPVGPAPGDDIPF